MHVDNLNRNNTQSQVNDNDKEESQKNYGGEGETTVNPKCTQVCGTENDKFKGRSCAKTVLVKVYPQAHPENSLKVYAIVDDQSNRSLAKPELFDHFKENSMDQIRYSLSVCGGKSIVHGRLASDLIIESVDGSAKFKLPNLIECDEIPNIRDEIPTPDIVRHHKHLEDLACVIPHLDPEAKILILVGRDLPIAHHVLEQRISSTYNAPYAQRLHLGWVVIGEMCLGKVHPPEADTQVITNKTYLYQGRDTLFEPCFSNIRVKEFPLWLEKNDNLGSSVFHRAADDDKPGMSVEDRAFVKLMEEEMVKNEKGNWIAPLPFRSNRRKLPNNRSQALNRAKMLDRNLQKDSKKRKDFVSFMKDIFDRGYAELAPPLRPEDECWYLPTFGIYHPRKPDQLRAVFDSSAKFDGVSLNDVLLAGPDLTNSLLGILIRFRKDKVAIVADIEKMFYSFFVQENHRNYFRFFWYENNDPSKPMTQYRMCVHVFGNSPSPAVATYGLRKTVEKGQEDMKQFVCRNFYVDDGITSLPTSSGAVDLMKRTQKILKSEGNLRLHKIASNRKEDMDAFPATDLAKDLRSVDLYKDPLPVQRSLGLLWNIEEDMFCFQVPIDEKTVTRRNVLSFINSLYDPLGFLSPVIITGKVLLREIVDVSTSWDDVLSEEIQVKWNNWKDSLSPLNQVKIPRTYSSTSLSLAHTIEIHIYADASELAISAVAYIVLESQDGQISTSFILGKSKLAPLSGHTVPRLELCAAVLAVEIKEIIQEQLDVEVSKWVFHTDSRVVLGYINNEKRRFYKYVSNRIEKIRRYSNPQDWHYIQTDQNQADIGTRCVSAQALMDSIWLKGPSMTTQLSENNETFDLVRPEADKEIKPTANTLKTNVTPTGLSISKFERFSQWNCLIKAIELLILLSRKFQKPREALPYDLTKERTVKTYEIARCFIIKASATLFLPKRNLKY